MNQFEIRQELDPTQLCSLSEEDRELADEVGEMDGNHHYLDLSVASWDDVAFALREERRLIERCQDCDDPEAVLAHLSDLDEERDALWHLELGVASAVMALNALGAHTALSCNGGAFGGVHLRDRPSVRFYLCNAPAEGLLALARESGVGLENEDGRVLLYSRTVQDLLRFAELALERFGPAIR